MKDTLLLTGGVLLVNSVLLIVISLRILLKGK